jgi:hypothetical protein
MYKRTFLALGLASLPGVVQPATAGQSELEQIRAEMREMRQAYKNRIEALENRIEELENRQETPAAETAAPAETPAPAQTAEPAQPSAPTAANAFNPAISLILEGTYTHAPDGTRLLPGFFSAEEIGPEKRGFSLAESELALSASIDPYLYGFAAIAVEPDGEVAIEEAYFQTLGLGHGFTAKGGRFFTAIGYLNEFHQHAWDFFDAPIAYQALLGTEATGNHGEDGVQLRWVAPTDTFLEVGAELGRGKDFPSNDRNKNGIGAAGLFAHLGGDIGASHSYRTGLSWLGAWPKDRGSPAVDLDDVEVLNLFEGDSYVYAADFVWKWAPNGDPSYRNFKLQGELLWRDEHGTLTYDAEDASRGANRSGYSSDQLGGYVQAVYQFHPRWRAGLRGELLHSTHLDLGDNAETLPDADHDPSKYSVMLDYSPSEFSRFRLQFAHQELTDNESDQQVILQYVHSLGSHGAHQF